MIRLIPPTLYIDLLILTQGRHGPSTIQQVIVVDIRIENEIILIPEI